ncbi:uncharacterized protein LOC111808443 [Cucurbita pepo subsp. pepo]|uniref:uncharacterized protein LOC111808443 n=1 Tax=Cucurbita pepo subsp. pepo TaxID=3664 RepID=UPI000C9D9C86|nr:uncharacterized protein LOC111808443 [Cucurbita pepo subsp. pepo]XP_023550187.1 uncharacterized protein LOC111808443 [Cucurbita pepo subsp. pepo]XP_023550188.1 uncharacterized protein LOC111808443 [Cucurbita pepo subsp. pepo]XP_023550189.1 uncharacterized protein LOC111808443 [Cucurbita pepo subsp. pepo]XP_023550190.1 uncharacterized protein LOC111808443 [Cucurbita pepo subsp. pepo]
MAFLSVSCLRAFFLFARGFLLKVIFQLQVPLLVYDVQFATYFPFLLKFHGPLCITRGNFIKDALQIVLYFSNLGFQSACHVVGVHNRFTSSDFCFLSQFMAALTDFCRDSGDISARNDLNTSPEMLKPSSASSDDVSPNSRGKSSDSGINMEGTAGWRLSNSPWNLQVIARSPGSLTRYMPDDIPIVTSPMVYIGMLKIMSCIA